MTVKNLLLFVTWRERYEEADQGLALSRRLKETCLKRLNAIRRVHLIKTFLPQKANIMFT
jgi:hypothetical protein